MNMQPDADPSKSPQEIWEDFSHSFTPAVREVVEFAKHIPGFGALSQNDQVTLLKAGTFEVRRPLVETTGSSGGAQHVLPQAADKLQTAHF